MSSGFNPYEPPRSGDAADPAMRPTSYEVPPPGSYRFEPADVVAAIRARTGRFGGAFVGSIAIVLLVVVVWNAVRGEIGRSLTPTLLAVVVVAPMLLVRWAAVRALLRKPEAQRSVHVSFDEQAITFGDEAGNSTRLIWSMFSGRRETADRVFLELPSKVSHVLPRRAWESADDFATVRDFLEGRVPVAKSSARPLSVLFVWIFLVMLFVAIWNFFSDVPRQPPRSAAPSASPR